MSTQYEHRQTVIDALQGYQELAGQAGRVAFNLVQASRLAPDALGRRTSESPVSRNGQVIGSLQVMELGFQQATGSQSTGRQGWRLSDCQSATPEPTTEVHTRAYLPLASIIPDLPIDRPNDAFMYSGGLEAFEGAEQEDGTDVLSIGSVSGATFTRPSATLVVGTEDGKRFGDRTVLANMQRGTTQILGLLTVYHAYDDGGARLETPPGLEVFGDLGAVPAAWARFGKPV